MTGRNRWNRIAWEAALTGCALLAISFAGLSAAAQNAPPWNAPASAKAVKNPVPATPPDLAAAKVLYGQTCAMCHGDHGDGEGLMGSSLEPHASNFTDAKLMRPQTDGELFWKINEGHGPMPSFKGQLSDMQIWQLVDYVRTFSKPAAGSKKAPAHKPQSSGS